MNKTPDWFKSWFNSPYYHILYAHRDEEEAEHFIDNLVNYLQPAAGALFLDMACGRGRHAVYLSEKGFRVTGIDLSEASIREASNQGNERLDFSIHDMRKVFRPGTYDYILNLFTSFGYFENEEDNLETLRAAHQNLKEQGYLVLDYFNAVKVAGCIVPEETKTVEGVTFHIRKRIENGFIIKQINFTDKGVRFAFTEQVRLFTLPDFEKMFRDSDFKIINLFGSYNLEKFTPESSDRLIIIAGKTS
jgi:SAM-dependent methyltransferase